jgi:hypothetical protein
VNSIKCPQCGMVNWRTAAFCKRCGLSFENLPQHAYVSLPAAEQAREHAPFYGQQTFPADSELQRKVWRWYVFFCVIVAGLYLFLAIAAIAVLVLDPAMTSDERFEMRIRALIFAIIGPLFMLPFAIAPFLPKKSWNWNYGLVLLIFGSLGGCCFWPITIPLIIQWLKPDIKQMFGKL